MRQSVPDRSVSPEFVETVQRMGGTTKLVARLEARSDRVGGLNATQTNRVETSETTPEQEGKLAGVDPEQFSADFSSSAGGSRRLRLFENNISNLVDQMLPQGLDASSGIVFDPLIESWAEVWRADSMLQQDADLARLDYSQVELMEQVAEVEAQYEAQLLRRKDASVRHASARSWFVASISNSGSLRTAGSERRLELPNGDPQPLSSLPPVNPYERVLGGLFVALAAMGQAAGFYPLLASLFRATDLLVIIAVLGFVAIAVGLSNFIGIELRRRVCGDPQHQTPLLIGALAVWSGLGIAATAASAALSDAASLISGTSLTLTALVFAALYLGAGALTAAASYQFFNPAFTALRRAARELDAANRRVLLARLQCLEARSRLDQVIAQQERVRARSRIVSNVLEAAETSAKNYARIAIAARLQDPAAAVGFARSAPRPQRDIVS